MFQVSFFKFRGRRITPLQCGPCGLGFPVGHVLERRRDEFPRGRRHLPTFYIISCQEYRRHGPLLRRKETLGQHWAKVNPATATSSRKQETLERCWFNAGTTSTTSASIGSTSRLFAADSPCACRLLRRFTPRPVAAQTSARGDRRGVPASASVAVVCWLIQPLTISPRGRTPSRPDVGRLARRGRQTGRTSLTQGGR